MGALDVEDQVYWEDVKAVKEWWKDPRWRHTKRPFTAEQIVAKRGNLKIEYPSNVQSKKLWEIVEKNFQVRFRLILPTPNVPLLLTF
jgi:isocitrate lyase